MRISQADWWFSGISCTLAIVLAILDLPYMAAGLIIGHVIGFCLTQWHTRD